MARRLRWRLVLVHVCRPRARPEAGVIAAAQRVVQEQLDWEHVEVIVESGPVPRRLATTAQYAELIVVGTRGEGAIRQTLFGSVAASLVRRPSRPVLVVPSKAASRLPLHGRTIACGLRDQRDLPCARVAAHLASELGLAFTAMHVTTPPLTSAVTAAGGAALPAAVLPAEPRGIPVSLRNAFGAAIARTVGAPSEIRLLRGPPSVELLRAASEESAAMIAIGASDRSPLGAALAGATSRRLLRTSDRPLLGCPRPTAAAS
jgi:nucleotide-binding universal stress UspA family protein